MDKIDKLLDQARNMNRKFQNEYVGTDNNLLLDMLSEPQEDWRLICQAMALNGGGFNG